MYLRIAVGAKIDRKADELVVRTVHRTLHVNTLMLCHSTVNLLICEENCHSIPEQSVSLQCTQKKDKT